MTPEIIKVRDFMTAAQQAVRVKPTTDIPREELKLRLELIAEELSELAESFGFSCNYSFADHSDPVNLVAALDGLTDMRYVTYGAFCTLGVTNVSSLAFNEVHASNMSKLIGGKVVRNEAGKVQKPKTYFPPNLSKFL